MYRSRKRTAAILTQLSCDGILIATLAISICQLISANQFHEFVTDIEKTAGHAAIGCPPTGLDGTLMESEGGENLQSEDDIEVNILIKPLRYLHCKYYIATNANFTAKAEIQDVKFKNVSVEYQWSVKERTIVTDKDASEIDYTFTKADENEFLSVLVSHRPNHTGTSKKDFVVRDPITVQEPKGKLFLEHGELLNITLNFSSGTKPINYCYRFCRDTNVRNSAQGCTECTPEWTTRDEQVSIIYYIRSVGNYTLVFVADNIASHVLKSYSVKIADTIRPGTVPYVPIVSSILAVVIVLSGLALHMKLKRTLITETADFDFIRHDFNEEEDFWDNEEFTFFQRVRYLFFREDRDNDTSVNDSVLSGVGF